MRSNGFNLGVPVVRLIPRESTSVHSPHQQSRPTHKDATQRRECRKYRCSEGMQRHVTGDRQDNAQRCEKQHFDTGDPRVAGGPARGRSTSIH